MPDTRLKIPDSSHDYPIIKIIGIGGSGCKAVQYLCDAGIEGEGVEFICMDTDFQAQPVSTAFTPFPLGLHTTQGQGTAGNPKLGRAAAIEDHPRIRELVQGADMVLIVTGLGGGTGSGAASVVGEITRQLDIVTVAVITLPDMPEAEQRRAVGLHALETLATAVDSVIVVDRAGLSNPLQAYQSLYETVQAMTEVITRPGLIGVDFADMRLVLHQTGLGVVGVGRGKGKQRNLDACTAATQSLLLKHIKLSQARSLLVNIIAGIDFDISEFDEIFELIVGANDCSDTCIVIQVIIESDVKAELQLVIVANGLEKKALTQALACVVD